MYELLDDIISALNSLEDAVDSLTFFPDEKLDTLNIIASLEEKKERLEKEIGAHEEKDKTDLEREYYSNLF